MMDFMLAVTIKMVLSFIGGWLLGFVAGWLYASTSDGSVD